MILEKHFTENLLATIVLYNTSLKQSATFQTLSSALSGNKADLLVYDNSPSNMYQGEIYHQWNIHYVHDPMNSGISKAYNQALTLAKSLGKEWLLLLDQDTSFPDNIFDEYASAIKSHSAGGLFVPRLVSQHMIISPFKTTPGKGKVLQTVEPGTYFFDELMPVNSGIMVKVKSFEACGGYNEAFPLDYSDFAFIERYKQHESYFEVLHVTCRHQFSGLEPSDKVSALQRFRHFCEATCKYKRCVDPKVNITTILFSRALKLFLRFKSSIFFKTALQSLLRRK